MASKTAFKIALEGNLGLRDVTTLTAQFRDALAAHPQIVVTTAGLTGIDITILQLLIAARKSALAAGKSLTLENPAGGTLARFLVKTGFVSPEGMPLTPEGDFWTQNLEGKAA